MISFAELSKRVHLINDLILSDMVCDPDDVEGEELIFSKHLLTTKYWFSRISYTNKKRYLLALLQDVRSAWTLSLLLKSMWNCRPKDAVMSVSEKGCCLSSYDQVPMDHNRTAVPAAFLALAMKNDHFWFLSLEPEAQALVLSELLTVAGGPAMWEVLRRAQTLYDRYRDQLLQNLKECIVVNDSMPGKDRLASDKNSKKEATSTSTLEPVEPQQPSTPTKGQKDLEANLVSWNNTIKAMQTSLKLEELEMTFLDGTKRKIWKVNRPKPDVMETVDFVQLLPSAIGKNILSFLPRTQLGDYARVNKYWAFLVEEYRAEISARAKINADLEKMNECIIKHDESLDYFVIQHDMPPVSEPGGISAAPGVLYRQTAQSVRPSEKSACLFSLRFLSSKLTKPVVMQKPIRNMAELNERMERRGATDENIWKWCENVVGHVAIAQKRSKKGVNFERMKGLESQHPKGDKAGVLSNGSTNFPSPLMKHSLVLPLDPPLYKDPAKTTPPMKLRKNITNAGLLHMMPIKNARHYGLWTRDVSPLYPVLKIPSHHFPLYLPQ